MTTARIHHGDCLAVMAGMEANSVDAVVTDPPYGLGFMGKHWDHGVPGQDFWREALRVAKPGAHLLAFGGTRTFHRLMVAIEDAGWEIRDTLGFLHGPLLWGYGSGFPKSLDISKAIDKAAGAERKRIGDNPNARDTHGRNPLSMQSSPNSKHNGITAPATDAARKWSGWGTALKPAYEPIILARKPLDGTVAATVLKWGTGGLNVDGCRVGVDPIVDASQLRTMNRSQKSEKNGWGMNQNAPDIPQVVSPSGRWPANIIHDGSEEVLGVFPGEAKGGTWNRTNGARHFNNNGEPTDYVTAGSDTSSGSAARFFYCAKASREDREEGLEWCEEKRCGSMEARNRESGKGQFDGPVPIGSNHHPTVKPTALMRYLCRLVTPPDGTVLDPFMGSGSTGKAAIAEGFAFVGIEREAEYVEIARRRINHALGMFGECEVVAATPAAAPTGEGDLFKGATSEG